MTFDARENDKILEAAVSGLPKVVEAISAMPEKYRTQALEAAQESYRKTALGLGYTQAAADQWTAAVMAILRLRVEGHSGRDEKGDEFEAMTQALNWVKSSPKT